MSWTLFRLYLRLSNAFRLLNNIKIRMKWMFLYPNNCCTCFCSYTVFYWTKFRGNNCVLWSRTKSHELTHALTTLRSNGGYMPKIASMNALALLSFLVTLKKIMTALINIVSSWLMYMIRTTVSLESRAHFTVNVLPCVALVTGIGVQGYLRMGKPSIATPKTLYPEAPLP